MSGSCAMDLPESGGSMGPLSLAWVQSLGWEDPLEKEKSMYSNILAWRTP